MPPNILYLHSHDTGRHVQPYGQPVATPRLQALAEDGVLFRQAFCASPTCSPSRSALLTGQWPHENGMMGLAHRGFALHDSSRHLVHTLRRAGYRSLLIGEQHLSVDPCDLGYDEVRTVDAAYRAEDVAPAAAAALAEQRDEPFFLSVGFFETHRPFRSPSSGAAAYGAVPPGLPDTPETRADLAGFAASAAALDAGIGVVLDALEAHGLADETLVICTTDHGMAFPGAKATLTDRGTGVMLIVRGPGGFTGGRVVDAMVHQLDLYPTLCQLAGLQPPSWVRGSSLLPLVRGEVERLHESVFSELTFHCAYEPQRAVRTRRWKYVRRFDEHGRPVLANVDDGPSKAAWVEEGWRAREGAAEQLYDLVFDPGEACNLAGDGRYEPVLRGMRERLRAWMDETGDPLLGGPVAAPPGSVMNAAWHLSPDDPAVAV